MRFNIRAKIILLGLLISATFGCQNQAVSNSANTANSKITANNANSANQRNAEIPAARDVKFTSADSVEIVGTFYESAKTDSPAVLLLHQFGSDRKSFDEYVGLQDLLEQFLTKNLQE